MEEDLPRHSRITKRMKAQCLSKVRYTHQLAAQYALDQMTRLPNSGKLDIYTCPICKGLHIGKNKHKNKTKPNEEFNDNPGRSYSNAPYNSQSSTMEDKDSEQYD